MNVLLQHSEDAQDARIVRIHGLTVRSDFALPAMDGEAPISLEVRRAERRTIPSLPPPGSLLAAIDFDPMAYTISEFGDGYLLRFPEACDVVVLPDQDRIDVHVDPRADDGFISVLLAGTILSCFLSAQGKTVLHASAVAVGPFTIALVGASGMGKSTVAALLCAGGARLISDDVLRVETESARIVCHVGTRTIRLRPAAAEIAAQFAHVSSTPDDRLAVAPATVVQDRLPLHAVVIPSPNREARSLEIDRLRPAEALTRLIRFPRVLGWKVPDPVRREFRALAELVERVPVFTAEIPWGPPFSSELAAELAVELSTRVGR